MRKKRVSVNPFLARVRQAQAGVLYELGELLSDELLDELLTRGWDSGQLACLRVLDARYLRASDSLVLPDGRLVAWGSVA